jgi:hypothetical protein
VIKTMIPKKIEELEAKIAELKKRWPAHSVSPGMMAELDDLEEELAKTLDALIQEKEDA